jgi:hypothetical protein
VNIITTYSVSFVLVRSRTSPVSVGGTAFSAGHHDLQVGNVSDGGRANAWLGLHMMVRVKSSYHWSWMSLVMRSLGHLHLMLMVLPMGISLRG